MKTYTTMKTSTRSYVNGEDGSVCNAPMNNSQYRTYRISSIMSLLWTILLLGAANICDARVAGKIGIYTNNYSGKSSSGINEEIIWVSIGMGITIAILITIALCYILTEKCKKRRGGEYFANT